MHVWSCAQRLAKEHPKGDQPTPKQLQQEMGRGTRNSLGDDTVKKHYAVCGMLHKTHPESLALFKQVLPTKYYKPVLTMANDCVSMQGLREEGEQDSYHAKGAMEQGVQGYAARNPSTIYDGRACIFPKGF